MTTRTQMKKDLITRIAAQLHSYDYTVYVSSNGEHGFYTDGTRVVTFGGSWSWSVDFSGNYKATTAEGGRRIGTGWLIDGGKELSCIGRHTADQFIKAGAPQWAVGAEQFKYTTPEQHLATYGKSSGYTLWEPTP